MSQLIRLNPWATAMALEACFGSIKELGATEKELDVPGYLTLFNPLDTVATMRVLEFIRTAAHSAPEIEKETLDLIRAPEWRANLVGAAVLLFLPPSPELVDALWQRIEGGS